MSLEASLEELAGQGYTIIEGALSSDEVEATRRAVIELLDAEEEVVRTTGTQTDNLRNAHAIVGKHPHFHEFYLNPPVMRIVRAVLGEQAMLYDGNIRVPMPTGERDAAKGFQVHVDREEYTVLPFAAGTHFPMALNVVWCLVDFTGRTAPRGCGRGHIGRARSPTPISMRVKLSGSRRPRVPPSSGTPPCGTRAGSTAATGRAGR